MIMAKLSQNRDIKCVIQGFTMLPDGRYCMYTGFSNGKAVLTAEKVRGFEKITIKDAYSIFNDKTVCPLRAPDLSLRKRHRRHINNYLKGI